MSTCKVPIAEVKSRFSEYASRSAHGNEHFIITRRGKPLAALVSLDELAMLESMHASRGLATAMGNWSGVEEVGEGTEEAYEARSAQGEGRDVSF